MFARRELRSTGGALELACVFRSPVVCAFILMLNLTAPLSAGAAEASNTASAVQGRVKVTTAAPAAEAEPEDTTIYRDYDDVFGETSARTLLMTARQHMRQHNYRRAITLLAKAVKLDPDDPDVLMLYASALSEKLSNQEEKDPDLFNLCVKTLLTVVRNEAGEEKGMTYKGIGIGAGFYQDEERTMRAKKDLKALTGYLPKPWETNARYLRRVLRPSSSTVTGTIKMPVINDKD
jgi:hypothetical protein